MVRRAARRRKRRVKGLEGLAVGGGDSLEGTLLADDVRDEVYAWDEYESWKGDAVEEAEDEEET